MDSASLLLPEVLIWLRELQVSDLKLLVQLSSKDQALTKDQALILQ